MKKKSYTVDDFLLYEARGDPLEMLRFALE